MLVEADRFLGPVVPDFPGLRNLFFRFDREEIDKTIAGVLREPLRKYADIIAQFDVDVVVLAGRASALPCVLSLMTSEMPVAPPRIKTMASYQVGDWYPSKWRRAGTIKDPKSTVTAGATVLHLASKNRLAGFMLDAVSEAAQPAPIYGLYQETEPHILRTNELFRTPAPRPAGVTANSVVRVSAPFNYTSGMTIGFRNVDSQEMDGSPLFEVRPASAEVERAVQEDRVSLRFAQHDDGSLGIAEVTSQKDLYQFSPDDFVLALKTLDDRPLLARLGRLPERAEICLGPLPCAEDSSPGPSSPARRGIVAMFVASPRSRGGGQGVESREAGAVS